MESISRVSTLLEAARELTLEASRDASSARRPLRPLPPAQIQKLLDSRSEREVLEGLRRVIAMQYTASLATTLPFFPAVLKTLSHPTSSTRPLVYAYLVHHAEADPDTALLAVNTIQKSLSDSNPRVRSLALKTMSALRMPVLSQIISLAIKKGVADMAPLVRRTAAFACVKCIRLDPSTLPQVTEYLAQLIGDPQYYVAGAAVAAFMEVCPERLDLVHKHYRSLVKKLVDMDEWGQLATLRLLTIYSRKCFTYRTQQVPRTQPTQTDKSNSFYDEETAQDENADHVSQQVLDSDLSLFLDSTLPLLQSRTSAVILSVANTYLSLAPSLYLHHAIRPLVALLRAPEDIRPIALHNIVLVALTVPQLFVRYHRHFTLHHTDSPQVFGLKLEILTLIFPHCSTSIQSLTLADLEHFSRSHDANIVKQAVRAIGRCAQASSAQTSARCLRLLLRQINSADDTLVAEALETIRHLIQQDPSRHKKTVVRLAKKLDELKSDKARASVIWLVGEFAGLAKLEESVAPDMLRILVRGYADEGDEVKGQIVLLAAKIYCIWCREENEKKKSNGEIAKEHQRVGEDFSAALQEDENGFAEANTQEDGKPAPGSEGKHAVELLWQHVLLLARYTSSYDLRDRARLFRALLSVSSSTDLASLLLLAPKPVPQAPSPSERRKGFQLGSASLIIGEDAGVHGLKGYEALPDWVKEGEEPDPRLRNAEGERREYAAPRPTAGRMLDDALKERGSGSNASSFKEKAPVSLDDWLNEEPKKVESEASGESEYETDEEETEYETDSEEEESDSDEIVAERRQLVS
ncbi:adaptin N terminal region-domain-containing protein [Elsinoe ampelina]|uniref:Adaptin N terminal region-domain-containing protein n=1 Tax=Elsinoe ampelina TaxID=302913 RepID=A0A6A6GMW1_9PEZI|nr:adaptin N terminal region-domain-containing protein [Elsinoe ampelina]